MHLVVFLLFLVPFVRLIMVITHLLVCIA